jgi:recombination protein RecA
MSDDLRELLAKAKGLATAAAAARILRLDGLVAQGSASVGSVGSVGAPGQDRWGLDVLRGRLVELSARGATATLTTAIELVLEAQHAAEPVAWVTLGNTTFYPPDLADSGVDLAALVVVRVLDATTAARAAERLLRSGAFGLVVLDFGGTSTIDVPIAHQGRLVTLAQTHDAAVVCITEKATEAASLGSLVSLRAEALRLHAREHDYDVTLRVLKDKRRGPGWSRTIKLRGPAGF